MHRPRADINCKLTARRRTVLAHLALGAPAEARVLAAEEVALAQAFHGAGTLGIALRAAGLAEGGSRGIELLRQAVNVLETPAHGWNTPAPWPTWGQPSGGRDTGPKAARRFAALSTSPTAAARSPSQSGPAPNSSPPAGDPGGSSSAGSTR